LPHDVLYRAKMGFRVPLATWLRGPLAQRAREALLTGAVAACGYFEPSVLDRLLREHIAGHRDHSATLWSLLMLDAFLRQTQQPAAADPGTTQSTARPGAMLPQAMP
jgi:asparagine synthase (glutamine-hydrolysing)